MNRFFLRLALGASLWAVAFVCGPGPAFGQTKPFRPQLENLDRRHGRAATAEQSRDRAAALAQLRQEVPRANVDFDELTRAPTVIRFPDGALVRENAAD